MVLLLTKGFNYDMVRANMVIIKKWCFVLFTALSVSSCALFYKGVTDLSLVDFAAATIQLRDNGNNLVSTVKPGNSYSLQLQIYNAEKNKLDFANMDKNVATTFSNNRFLSGMRPRGVHYQFNVSQGTMAMIEEGKISVTFTNAQNQSKVSASFPFDFNDANLIILPPQNNGNGANAVFEVALFDTSKVGSQMGSVLLLINRNTGESYITGSRVTIVAKGATGRSGAEGREGESALRRGWSGDRGGDGSDGGQGGVITVTGSKAALSGISFVVTGGSGGAGGMGGRGGAGGSEVITEQQARERVGDIESMSEVPQAEPYSSSKQRMVRVKYYDGSRGPSGRAGRDGKDGQGTFIEAGLIKENFSSFMQNAQRFNVEMLQ